MRDAFQALCFLAGGKSRFIGARRLTAQNPEKSRDDAPFKRLGLDAPPADFRPSAGEAARRRRA